MCSVCATRAARQGGTHCRPCPDEALWSNWTDPKRVTLVLFSFLGLLGFLAIAVLRPVLPSLDERLLSLEAWAERAVRSSGKAAARCLGGGCKGGGAATHGGGGGGGDATSRQPKQQQHPHAGGPSFAPALPEKLSGYGTADCGGGGKKAQTLAHSAAPAAAAATSPSEYTAEDSSTAGGALFAADTPSAHNGLSADTTTSTTLAELAALQQAAEATVAQELRQSAGEAMGAAVRVCFVALQLLSFFNEALSVPWPEASLQRVSWIQVFNFDAMVRGYSVGFRATCVVSDVTARASYSLPRVRVWLSSFPRSLCQESLALTQPTGACVVPSTLLHRQITHQSIRHPLRLPRRSCDPLIDGSLVSFFLSFFLLL